MSRSTCRRGHTVAILGRTSDGHCRACRHQDDLRRAKNPARREKTRAAIRRWGRKNRDYLRLYQHEWQKTNHDRVAATQSRYYYRNREHRIAVSSAWLREHPEARRMAGQNCRARRWEAISHPIPRAVLRPLFVYYRRRCAYCFGPYEELDHLYPLSKGGAHSLENLAPSCRRCNRRKNNRPIWTLLTPMPTGEQLNTGREM